MSATRKRNPEKMKKICSFVEEYFFKYHRSPTMQKIADELGVSKSTAYYYINEMAEKGMLSYDGKTISTSSMQKSIHLANRAPMVGNIVCGTPEYSEENFEGYVALPEALFGKGDFFVLRTHGESMIDAGIDNGDMVVVSKQNTANIGDMVVALVDNETTLKTYMVNEEGRMFLRPQNKSMSDIYPDNCFIQGVIRFIIKAV
jgi:repressor LexA